MLVSGKVTNNTVSKFCPSRNFLIITAVENSWNVLHLLYSVDIIFLLVFYGSNRLFASMESFRKGSRINSTLEFTDAMPCYYLSIAAVFGHFKRPVIFRQSECCVLGRTRCILKAMPSLQVLRYFPWPFTSSLRSLTHLSRLCSSTLPMPQPMRARSQATCNKCAAIFQRKKWLLLQEFTTWSPRDLPIRSFGILILSKSKYQ